MNSYINKYHYDTSNVSKAFEIMCLTFYWTEGSKYPKMVEVTNTDPVILSMFSLFLLKVCNVEPLKLKGRLQIHEGNSIEEAKEFWVKNCDICYDNISVSIRKKALNPKKNIHKYGIFTVRYNSVGLKNILDLKIEELKNLGFKV